MPRVTSAPVLYRTKARKGHLKAIPILMVGGQGWSGSCLSPSPLAGQLRDPPHWLGTSIHLCPGSSTPSPGTVCSASSCPIKWGKGTFPVAAPSLPREPTIPLGLNKGCFGPALPQPPCGGGSGAPRSQQQLPGPAPCPLSHLALGEDEGKWHPAVPVRDAKDDSGPAIDSEALAGQPVSRWPELGRGLTWPPTYHAQCLSFSHFIRTRRN